MAWEDQVKTELQKIIEAIENGSKHVAEEIAEFLGIEKEEPTEVPAAEPAVIEPTPAPEQAPAPEPVVADPSPPVQNI
jgi:hypothetical protein